ncbi:MAG: hypothetical protein LBD82_05540 [Deltaproteobacteria bacterium]|jgi:hypothetical protein|nr:hypothetical protein [Deltaproteobacteria bacterium]
MTQNPRGGETPALAGSVPEGPGPLSRAANMPPSPDILYTEEDVFRHFAEVMASIDLRQEIVELGHGLNGFFKRRRTLKELNALCTALWKLALEQSFPHESEVFFAHYLERHPSLGKGKKRNKNILMIENYCGLAAAKKTGDFTPLAQYMVNTLKCGTKDEKVLLLKLSLTIRKFYQIIFNYLI